MDERNPYSPPAATEEPRRSKPRLSWSDVAFWAIVVVFVGGWLLAMSCAGIVWIVEIFE